MTPTAVKAFTLLAEDLQFFFVLPGSPRCKLLFACTVFAKLCKFVLERAYLGGLLFDDLFRR